ncbi:MAG: hypothetical protein EOO48_09155, partial [Flavobacterium sp.]
MKNLYKMAFAALAIGAIGCSSDDGGASQPGNCDSNIPFFHTGKFFKYNVAQFGINAGTMKLSFGECSGDGFASTMESRNTSNVVTSTIPNTFWQDGAFIVGDANNDGIDFHKIYKKDAALNDSWTETDADGAVITHTVVDMDSLITVPAGSFHCKVYHYEKSDIINDSYIFWDDGVG